MDCLIKCQEEKYLNRRIIGVKWLILLEIINIMIALKNLINRLVVLLSVVSVTSCGIHRASQVDERAIVNGHYEERDVIGLIKDLSLYPAYRDEAENALFYKIDYSQYRYDTITLFDKAAQDDFRAAAFFDSLKVDIESKALGVIANTNIEGVGSFYKSHSDLRNFLSPYIRDTYFTSLDTLGYKTLKSLYTSFSGTDLSDIVYPSYRSLRKRLLEEITESLDKYFKSEEELLEDIEYSVRVATDSYVKEGTRAITQSLVEKNSRTLFQKIFKHKEQDRYSFAKYANMLINKYFEGFFVTNEVALRLEDYIKSTTEYRFDICQQYLNKVDDKLFISNTLDSHQLVWEIGGSHIDTVQGIKTTGTVLSVGSMALGFVPGIGAVAIAADVIDLAYGLSQDSQIDSAMEELTNALYGDSLDSIEEYLQGVFGDVRRQRAESENNIRRRLYEEF